MAKIVHEHREISAGNIHAVVNWIVGTITNLDDIRVEEYDKHKLALVTNAGYGPAIYIITEVSNSGVQTWMPFSTLTGHIQPDWNQNNANSPDYIQHRPTIPSRLSDLSNDMGYIDSIDDDMVINALGFTPQNRTTQFDGDYNNLTNKPNLDFARIDDVGQSSTRTYSSQRIEARLQEMTGGAMQATTYDPTGVSGDAFDYRQLHHRPENLSDFDDDVGYLKNYSDIIETLGFTPLSTAQAFDGNYNNLTNKPNLDFARIDDNSTSSSVNTYSVFKINELINNIQNSGMLTSVYDPDGVGGDVFDYSNIKNPPTIPDEQVQSDWKESDSTKKSFIKNKPELFSGDYNDLKNKPEEIPDDISYFNNDMGYVDVMGASILPIKRVAGRNYDMNNPNDVGKVILFNSSQSTSVNIEALEEEIPYGGQISFGNEGSGVIEIVASGSVVIEGPTRLSADSIHTIFRQSSSRYFVIGKGF